MDRISGLSDELLTKILLFLPTKFAVSTSVLSKRWECLWMLLPRLEYDVVSPSLSEGKMLRCFLDRYLPLHRASVIERLRLKLCNLHFKPEDVKLCVLTAISHIIRELEISYYSNPPNPDILPSSLYACKSLVILKFSGLERTGAILLDVPRLGCLASLKTLKLQNARYLNEDSFRRLLSICPVLKHLSVDRCKDDNMGDFTIRMQSLERLSIYIPGDCDLNGYVIDTPSLKLFKLEDHNQESHSCLIENMPMLRKAYIDVEFPDIKSLIGSIAAVKRLRICSKAMYGDGFVFNQLEHLKLCVCIEYSPNLLVRLLEDSPNLQVLDLFIMDHRDKSYMNLWNQPSTVPECLLSSLQTFIWSRGYKGTPEQRDIVVYILENASQLRATSILSFEDGVPKLEMLQELALSSRASTKCRLAFR